MNRYAKHLLFIIATIGFCAAEAQAQALWESAVAKNKTENRGRRVRRSHYSNGDPSKRTYELEDHITVIVREITKSTTTGTMRKNQSTEVEITLDKLVRFAKSKNGLGPNLRPALGGDDLAVEFEAAKDTNNRIQKSRVSQLEEKITVRIKKVYPNGNVAIEGYKRRQVNGELETFRISGIIDPRDIDKTTNTIMSDRIASFVLDSDGEGNVSDIYKQGFFGKLLDAIWPF